MTKDRGFKGLLDATIIKVDAKAINEVKLQDSDGNVWVVEGTIGPLNIPVLTLRKEDKK